VPDGFAKADLQLFETGGSPLRIHTRRGEVLGGLANLVTIFFERGESLRLLFRSYIRAGLGNFQRAEFRKYFRLADGIAFGIVLRLVSGTRILRPRGNAESAR
jgi:hypothetical protein